MYFKSFHFRWKHKFVCRCASFFAITKSDVKIIQIYFATKQEVWWNTYLPTTKREQIICRVSCFYFKAGKYRGMKISRFLIALHEIDFAKAWSSRFESYKSETLGVIRFLNFSIAESIEFDLLIIKTHFESALNFSALPLKSRFRLEEANRNWPSKLPMQTGTWDFLFYQEIENWSKVKEKRKRHFPFVNSKLVYMSIEFFAITEFDLLGQNVWC